jgi:HEAT repeat protein
VEALRDRAKNVRVAAAYALGAIGPDARVAVPALRAMANQKDGDVRSATAYALEQIEGKE